MKRHPLHQSTRYRILDLGALGLYSKGHALPTIASCFRNLDHPGGQIRVTYEIRWFLQIQLMAMRFVFDQASWLHEDNLQPLLVQSQVSFGVGEVAVDVGEGGHQQPVQDRGTFFVVFLVEAGGTQPDNGGEFGLRVRHPDVHQGNDDGLGGILSNVHVGHVVIARHGRKDGIGAFETCLDDGGVADVSGEYLDIGVGCNVGGLLQQLGFGAYVDVDLVCRVLYKEFQYVAAGGARGT